MTTLISLHICDNGIESQQLIFHLFNPVIQSHLNKED